MKKWLPKAERKTILLLSDDMRIFSGVGVMSREIIENTCGYYNWIQVGAAINHPEKGTLIDISADVQKMTSVEDPYVRIIPQHGYGSSHLIRQILENEKPSAIVHFTDPRYWIWLYQIEHEIRQKIPMMFYTIWDDLPYPMYNRNFYRSDDGLFAISKQTYNIIKQVLGEEAKDKTIRYIPHGIDTNKYFPIAPDDKTNQTIIDELKTKLFEGNNPEFVLFYNARNLRRKQTSDMLLGYSEFLKKLTPEEQEKCRILLHTQPVDENGTDLPAVIRDVMPNVKAIFSNQHVGPEILNALYNIADVTINVASNEGFGLSTCESLLAGTPIIVNVTGGLQDHCGFKNDNGEYLDPERDFSYEWGSNHDGRYKNHGEWVFPIFPNNRSLQGSPLTPYIFDDRCDWKDISNAIYETYKLTREERKRRGLAGRDFAMTDGQFTAERLGELFIEGIDSTIENFKPRERYTLVRA